MNKLIELAIDTHINSYIKGLDSSLDSLGEEDVFLKHEDGGIKILSNNALSQGILIRLQLVLPYLGKAIINNMPINQGVILCLGDCPKVSYNTSFPVLCLSKAKDINAIPIPNIDFFTKSLFKDLSISQNDIDFNEKRNGSIFIGASTGELKNNTRVKYATKYSNNSSHFGYISILCQHSESEWLVEYPNIKSLIHPGITIRDQLKYKIVVNIDGNTVCWSRLYWQMASNSIPVYIEESTKNRQFFDVIDKKNCYIGCSLDDSLQTYEYILDPNNIKEVNDIIENGQQYCRHVFGDYLNDPDTFLQEILDYIIFQFYRKQNQ